MKPPSNVAVLLLAAACVVIAYGASIFREGTGRAPGTAPLPRGDLVLAVAGADLSAALAGLDASPFWAGALRAASPARMFVDTAPGALGIYRRGWLVLSSRSFPDTPTFMSRHGTWFAAASGTDRLPRDASESTEVALSRGAASVAWAAAAGTTSPAIAGWSRALPARAEGIVDPRAGRETWAIACDGPCLLDALRVDTFREGADRRWDALPPDPVAVAEAAFDPAALVRALDIAAIGDVERFLNLPLRRELARALAGRAAIALVEEPAAKSPGALIAVFDLSRTDAARALVERVLALGVLSGELGIEHYRDVMVGSWTHPGGTSQVQPALAIDGDALILATRKRDLLAALDRRRRPRGEPSAARIALEASGPAAWRGWSRSSFQCTEWLELVTGRRAESALAGAEVTSRLEAREGSWFLESRGDGPAFAAEPVLPAARSVLRTLRAAR